MLFRSLFFILIHTSMHSRFVASTDHQKKILWMKYNEKKRRKYSIIFVGDESENHQNLLKLYEIKEHSGKDYEILTRKKKLINYAWTAQ